MGKNFNTLIIGTKLALKLKQNRGSKENRYAQLLLISGKADL